MKPLLLVLVYITPEHRKLVSKSFELIYAPNEGLGADRSNGAAQIAARGSEIQVVLTNGTNGITPEEIDAMPRLKIICTLGVGFENVAIAHATACGIRVANAAATNDSCVADHAMALLLSAIRRVPTLNVLVRQGVWRDDIPRPPHVSGKRIGIVGLGAIGRKIARRAEGFDMEIGYFGRNRKDDAPYAFFDSLHALAAWCDFLIVATPGGKETFHLIDAEVLTRLGPGGVLVNIARGSVVDTAAVADALREHRIFSAALDVYEGEPTPPAALLGLENAILTPHVGGISPEAIQASVQRFIDNATRHFAGEPLLTPIN
ncbi:MULTISPECIES: 2-hydroxyacid dehydrogenase [unclassified Variovorax]|uniref:2-hydroxyacid dehydrogenase n=1 Tax=unclassified Variovorax TaxID=663243 RepID=UPI0008BCA10F|nr:MULTISPECIES: 2-hydroxyacid dehydrogenase [unclassified Variovorax]SEK16159.1 D-3-phosphoglycerate dehydrogenase/hypothetical protein [Variovorax sp. OK202]SFE35596.1 D-3-phosphoglycerate dehydrogenase/hypothetical protein [Variovorax sp. OK212]